MGNPSRAKQLGVTDDDYARLLAAQDGHCAICPSTPKTRRLHVDHDHKVEELHGTRASIRGLLCASHNKVLRDVRDSVPILRALIEYLEDPPARKVLSDSQMV